MRQLGPGMRQLGPQTQHPGAKMRQTGPRMGQTRAGMWQPGPGMRQTGSRMRHPAPECDVPGPGCGRPRRLRTEKGRTTMSPGPHRRPNWRQPHRTHRSMYARHQRIDKRAAVGTGTRTRTETSFRSTVCDTAVSTNSTIPATRCDLSIAGDVSHSPPTAEPN
jgi:hypothetical protein